MTPETQWREREARYKEIAEMADVMQQATGIDTGGMCYHIDHGTAVLAVALDGIREGLNEISEKLGPSAHNISESLEELALRAEGCSKMARSRANTSSAWISAQTLGVFGHLVDEGRVSREAWLPLTVVLVDIGGRDSTAMTNREVADVCRLGLRQTAQHLAELQACGLLKNVGKAKRGRRLAAGDRCRKATSSATD